MHLPNAEETPLFRRGGSSVDVGRGRLRRPRPVPAHSLHLPGRRKRPLHPSLPLPPLRNNPILFSLPLHPSPQLSPLPFTIQINRPPLLPDNLLYFLETPAKLAIS